MKKIGIFGGSFNPIHIGHIILANDILEYYGLDKIIFIPAYEPPLKDTTDLIPYEARYKMIEAAIEPYADLEISDIEKSLPKPSFTINTLKKMSELLPHASLYLIIGADQAEQFNLWKDGNKIMQIAKIIVMARNDKVISNEKMLSFNKRQIDISSTEIRERIKTNLSYRQFLPFKVYQIIKNEKLYR